MDDQPKLDVNPNLYKPTYLKLGKPHQGKTYQPAFTFGLNGKGAMITRRGRFKTATDAQNYARRVHSRWTKAYTKLIGRDLSKIEANLQPLKALVIGQKMTTIPLDANGHAIVQA